MDSYWSERARLKAKYKSKLHYVLTSLIPYSEANFKLAFKPNLFFNDLDKLDSIKREVARSTYYRAISQGYISLDKVGTPKLTKKGWRKLDLYQPRKLNSSACLIVTFDIPEAQRLKRKQLRVLLRELKFKQVQLSVWQSKYDSIKYLKEEIRDLGIEDMVNIYEAVSVK